MAAEDMGDGEGEGEGAMEPTEPIPAEAPLETPELTEPTTKQDSAKGKDGSEMYVSAEGEPLPNTIMRQLTHFRRKQEKGFVDVWWLYDDGG